jgi:hypothetical protein
MISAPASVKIGASRDGGIGRRVGLRILGWTGAGKRTTAQVAEKSRADALDLGSNDASDSTKMQKQVPPEVPPPRASAFPSRPRCRRGGLEFAK